MDAAVQPAKQVPNPEPASEGKGTLQEFGWLPCQVSLEILTVGFTVSDLLHLKQGSIVETGSPHTKDVPLLVNGLLIGWTEFEVIGNRLAVRITELS
jgi:flagellar motor switch/type III secretory pathway protein FliN